MINKRFLLFCFLSNLYLANSQVRHQLLRNVDSSLYEKHTYSLSIPQKAFDNNDKDYLGEVIDIQDINQKLLSTKIAGVNVKLFAINVPKAKSMAIYFKNLFLWGDSKLYIYNQRDTLEYNSKNIYKGEYFSTDFINGDNIKVLLIGNYRDIFILHQLAVVPNITKNTREYLKKSNQPCDIDVNCYSNNSVWNKQKRAVMKIIAKNTNVVNSIYTCTGVMINSNNYINNKKPYILTADHCFSKSYQQKYLPPTKEDLLAFKFIFNYEKTSCDKNDQNQNQFLIGTDLIANEQKTGDEGVDFVLLRLKSEVPKSFNPYYSGLNISDDLSSMNNVNYSIHHLLGREKKIAITSSIKSAISPVSILKQYSAWMVEWKVGGTVSGSSGAPIFDQNGYLIGLLSGGIGQCGKKQVDYYSKLSYIWSFFDDTKRRLDKYIDKNNQMKGNILEGLDPYGDAPKQDDQNSVVIINNPLNDNIQIIKNPNVEVSHISVWDIVGKLIIKKDGNIQFPISLNYLNTGVYIIRFKIKNNYYKKRILYLEN